MRRIFTTALFIALFPVLVLTFKWWGVDYYRSVIN